MPDCILHTAKRSFYIPATAYQYGAKKILIAADGSNFFVVHIPAITSIFYRCMFSAKIARRCCE